MKDDVATATSDRVLIFANPIAGRGQGIRIAEVLERRLVADGYLVRKLFDRPTELNDDDLQGTARAAIVIGGDGTLRGVAERLLQADMLPPLLPVPLGTANLMGRYLGIRGNESDLAERVSAGITRHKVLFLDAGRANGRLFLLIAGIGFDAQIVHHLDRLRRGPIRFWDYLLPAALSVHEYPAAPLRVTLDGREIFPEGQALAFIGNLAEYGTGFPVTPFARPDDGLLDVCVLPCRSRSELIQMFLLAAAGEHVRAEGVVYQRGRHVRIESPVSVPIQLDGDPAGHTPVEIDLLAVRVPFIVPMSTGLTIS
jgi:diacylglycerol kinase (ATP)